MSLINTTFAPELGVDLAASQETAIGVYVRDITVGSGATLAPGQTVGMYYSGFLANGTSFDARTSGAPLTFRLGSGQVIKGWDDGLVGMKVGGSRQIVIPPEHAYGSRGIGPIPPDSVLVFNVEARSAE